MIPELFFRMALLDRNNRVQDKPNTTTWETNQTLQLDKTTQGINTPGMRPTAVTW